MSIARSACPSAFSVSTWPRRPRSTTSTSTSTLRDLFSVSVTHGSRHGRPNAVSFAVAAISS